MEKGDQATLLVQSLWIGASLSSIQYLSIRSFLENGHEYHLYTYDEIDNVPEGTTICDASSILPRENIFCYQDGFGKGSYAAFSNLFRYTLIFAKGGWWVDTDMVCIKPFDFKNEFVFAEEREKDGTTMAASCVLKSPAGADYLNYCCEACNAKDKVELKWGEIGPHLFNDAIKLFNLRSYLMPPDVFNPVNHFEFTEVLEPGFDASRLASSYAVHLWNQMWKSQNIDANHDWPADSLYALLRRRYLSSTGMDMDAVTRLKQRGRISKNCIEGSQRSLSQAEKEAAFLETLGSNFETLSEEDHISRLEARIRDQQMHIRDLETTLDQKQKNLNAIYDSRGWKLLLICAAIYKKIFPIDSIRRRIAKTVSGFLWQMFDRDRASMG